MTLKMGDSPSRPRQVLLIMQIRQPDLTATGQLHGRQQARVSADARSAPPASRRLHDSVPAGNMGATAQMRPCLPLASRSRRGTLLPAKRNVEPDGR